MRMMTEKENVHNSSRLDYSTEPGVYTYTENEHGKSAYGVVKNGAQSERDRNAQRTAGGADRRANDQGGHLIAHSMGGRNDSTNLDAQNGNVNQIDQKHIEDQVRTLAEDPNNTVAVHVDNYKSVSEVPDATMYNAGVMNNETGKTDEVHLSFQNMSHAEQQEMNDLVDSLDLPADPSQYAGLSNEEIALSHEYADAADHVDMSLGQGEVFHFDTNDKGDEIMNDNTAEYDDSFNVAEIEDDGLSDTSSVSEDSGLSDDGGESGGLGMDE